MSLKTTIIPQHLLSPILCTTHSCVEVSLCLLLDSLEDLRYLVDLVIWAGLRWQTRLSLRKQPWLRHEDMHVNHAAKEPWQRYEDWSWKHFDLPRTENVGLHRIQVGMNPQEVGQGNYSAMVDLIAAGLWSNSHHLHGSDTSVYWNVCTSSRCVSVWVLKTRKIQNKWLRRRKNRK